MVILGVPAADDDPPVKPRKACPELVSIAVRRVSSMKVDAVTVSRTRRPSMKMFMRPRRGEAVTGEGMYAMRTLWEAVCVLCVLCVCGR